MYIKQHGLLNYLPSSYNIHFTVLIWALARAPDLHLNIHQLVTSSSNSTKNFHTFPTNCQPGHLNIYAWHVTVPDSRLSTLSTTEKQQNVTFLIGYNSRTV